MPAIVMVYRSCNKVTRPIDHSRYGFNLQCTHQPGDLGPPAPDPGDEGGVNAPAPRVRQPGGRGHRQQQDPPLLVHQPGDLSLPAPDPGEDGGGVFLTQEGGEKDTRMEVVPLTREEERKIVDN